MTKKVAGLGEAILDTGCSDATMTLKRWHLVSQELKQRRIAYNLTKVTEPKVFKIADGQSVHTVFFAEFSVPVIGKPMESGNKVSVEPIPEDGCPFYPRCSHATESCLELPFPSNDKMEPAHQWRCHHSV